MKSNKMLLKQIAALFKRRPGRMLFYSELAEETGASLREVVTACQVLMDRKAISPTSQPFKRKKNLRP